jgi:hypothetical protein
MAKDGKKQKAAFSTPIRNHSAGDWRHELQLPRLELQNGAVAFQLSTTSRNTNATPTQRCVTQSARGSRQINASPSSTQDAQLPSIASCPALRMSNSSALHTNCSRVPSRLITEARNAALLILSVYRCGFGRFVYPGHGTVRTGVVLHQAG